jgi:hypothetical protein
MTSRNKRWRLFADFQIQGLLCARIVGYWIACQLAMIVTMYAILSMTEGSAPESRAIWRLVLPGWIVSSLLLPIMLFDMVAFSNRFAGPIFNFRRRFKQLVANEPTPAIRFRPNDFFLDLSDNFNTLRERLQPESAESPDGFAQADCAVETNSTGLFSTVKTLPEDIRYSS